MRREDFIEAIKNGVADMGEIITQEVNRANTQYTGLTVRKVGIPVPVVNLDELYIRYEDTDATMEDCIERAREVLAMAPPSSVSIEKVTDWEIAKTKLYFRPMKHVDNGLFKKMEDIFLVPYIQLADDCSMATRVTPQLCEHWGVTEEEVFEVTRTNQEELLPATITDMCEILGMPAAPFPILVISNKIKAFGASAIFYEGVVDMVRERIGGDFYLLPSSVHEMIAVPKMNNDVEALRTMVTSINGDVVDACDRLSNSVYTYDNGEFRRVV